MSIDWESLLDVPTLFEAPPIPIVSPLASPLPPSPLWPFPDKPPREVQLEALEAAKGHKGFAFFMRQRLGKTLTAYAEYKNLLKAGEVKWMVIICNNLSLIHIS